MLHGVDPALLTELLGSRALAPLGLARLTDTVLTSARPLTETLTALRLAGYAPMGENADGYSPGGGRRAPPGDASPPARAHRPWPPRRRAVYASLRRRARSRDPRRSPGCAGDPDHAASAPPSRPARGGVRRGTVAAGAPDASFGDAELDDLSADEVHQVLHQLISAQARHLSHDEVCLIADALQTEEAVTIVYDNADGERTRRVIEPLNLDGHLLEAWCRLRDDERVFALARIRSVHPVLAARPSVHRIADCGCHSDHNQPRSTLGRGCATNGARRPRGARRRAPPACRPPGRRDPPQWTVRRRSPDASPSRRAPRRPGRRARCPAGPASPTAWPARHPGRSRTRSPGPARTASRPASAPAPGPGRPRAARACRASSAPSHSTARRPRAPVTTRSMPRPFTSTCGVTWKPRSRDAARTPAGRTATRRPGAARPRSRR